MRFRTYLASLLSALALYGCAEKEQFVDIGEKEGIFSIFKYSHEQDIQTNAQKLVVADKFDEWDEKRGNKCKNTGWSNVFRGIDGVYLKARCSELETKVKDKIDLLGDHQLVDNMGYPMDKNESRLTDYFGTRGGHHNGIDITSIEPGKCEGMPIYAALGGQVKVAGYCLNGHENHNNGYWVKLQHSRKRETVYLHLQPGSIPKKLRTCKPKGKRVTRGQYIGRCGSTGRSSGPHLHFEYRKKRRAINPLK